MDVYLYCSQLLLLSICFESVNMLETSVKMLERSAKMLEMLAETRDSGARLAARPRVARGLRGPGHVRELGRGRAPRRRLEALLDPVRLGPGRDLSTRRGRENVRVAF